MRDKVNIRPQLSYQGGNLGQLTPESASKISKEQSSARAGK